MLPAPAAPVQQPPAGTHRTAPRRAPRRTQDARRPDAGDRRVIRVEVLGPLRITAHGQEISGGLRKARELLAFLAVHPGGATPEAISEALWPESPPSHGAAQRTLALRKARTLLRAAAGLTEPMLIVLAAGRYRLDPATISTDIADFQAALEQARLAPDDRACLAACQKAAALYRGPLADGAGYDWAEPYAETARRRALDAWTRIAEILEPASPDQALAALETALSHDPYNEYLYQRIMRLQAAAGRPDAARRTMRSWKPAWPNSAYHPTPPPGRQPSRPPSRPVTRLTIAATTTITARRRGLNPNEHRPPDNPENPVTRQPWPITRPALGSTPRLELRYHYRARHRRRFHRGPPAAAIPAAVRKNISPPVFRTVSYSVFLSVYLLTPEPPDPGNAQAVPGMDLPVDSQTYIRAQLVKQ